jgi:calcineurin-like phosphoesterase family protein
MNEKLDTIALHLMQACKLKPGNTLSGKNVFFTSDTHFGHTSILRHCNRPFGDIEEMNQALVENWNRVVGKNDLVFHLGDFAFGGAEMWNRFLDQLNGRIVLVVGNHDIYHLRAEMLERFEQVAFELYVVIDNQPIFLNHHPFLSYGDSHGKVWQLFGHVHTRGNGQGKEKDKQRLPLLMATQYDVGVDNNNYIPVSFYQIRDIISSRTTGQMQTSF